MNLGIQIANKLIAEANSPIKTIIAIYPGRFQPMGKHHAQVYDWLAKQFGEANTYIATSDKVDPPTSPFNFQEKRSIILKHGINNIVQEKNVYAPDNILKKYDPATTAVVFVYGAKDAGRLRTTKADGSPGYFQEFAKSKNNLLGYDRHGYFVISPHISLKVKGYGEMSGTTIRQALASADKATFQEIFGWFDPVIFDMIKKKLAPTTLKEDINIPINIGDTVMMGRFKNKKVVVKDIVWNEKGDLMVNGRSAMRMRIVPQEPKSLGESLAIQLLNEGGAAGHMNHPFDDRDITFADMKQMIRLSLEGKLNIESGVQEKTDGQALAITFKNGKVGAARNKTTIKTPMDIDAVKSKFTGRGEIEKAFSFAMQDLENALLQLPIDKLNGVFQNGTRFLNIEIIYPGTKNVIMYGPKAYIQFHGVDEYDIDLGVKIDAYPEYASLLQKMIANVNANIQKQFEIIPPKILTTNQLPNFEEKEQYFINKVNFLQKQLQLKDTDEIVMWHQKWWETKIEQLIPNATDDIKLGLLKRWAYFDKSMRLNSKTIPDPEILQTVKKFDTTDFAKQNKENVYHFEKIFLELGVEILYNISDYLSVVPSKATNDIKQRIASKIKVIQQSKDLASLEKLKFELKRIEDLGGFEKLVPAEGIVFMYKGKTYKLTGLFAPINQLLGIGGLSDK
jgi:hypothetical protein